MLRKLFESTTMAILVALLAIPANATEVQIEVLHTSNRGSVLPRHTSKNSGSGITVAIDIPTIGLTTGVAHMNMHYAPVHGGVSRYTDPFIRWQGTIDIVAISVTQMYKHANTPGMPTLPFREGDRCETMLKAEFQVSDTWTPYAIGAFLTPPKFPITESVGLGGAGVAVDIPVPINWITLHNNSYILVSLFAHNHEREVAAKNRTLTLNIPKIEIGLNIARDVFREKT